MKLVVVAWDTTEIKINKPSNFHHQARLYSTKTKSNAMGKCLEQFATAPFLALSKSMFLFLKLEYFHL